MFYRKILFRIYWLVSILMVLFISTPSAYSKKRDTPHKKNELRFWHFIGTYNKNILISSINTFNETNRLTLVKGIFQGNEEDIYLKLLSRENLPDIVQIPVHFLPTLKEKDYLADITSLITNKLKGDISEKFWNSVSIQERIYGIPFLYSVNILFVNQHMLRISGVKQEKVPLTWDDIITITGKIKQNPRNKWAVFIPIDTMTQFISFVQSYTGKAVIQDGRIIIDTDEITAAMAFLQNLVYQYEIMPPKISVDEGVALFLSGNLGIMLASSSILVYTESNLPYDMNVWHLPSHKNIPPVVTGSCLVILKSNPKREREAFKFIEHLIDYDNAITWHTHTGNPSIRTSVKESLDLLIFYEDNPNHMASTIELEKGEIYNPVVGYMDVNKIIKKALEEIMINGEDPDKILSEAQAEINKLDIVF